MEKYNKLTLIEFSEPRIRLNGSKRIRAIFECECGFRKDLDYSAVRTGHTKQCKRCATKSMIEKRRTHNKIKHPLYRKWQDMKKRCYNPKVDRYNCYGAIGIKVCEEWKNSFENFYEWSINAGWKPGLTIERKDPHKNYCPENCCYITLSEQNFNRRDTRWVMWEGKKISLSKLAHTLKISHKYRSLSVHVRSGYNIVDIVKAFQQGKRFIQKEHTKETL